jgi:hypothetical protein
MMRAERQIVLDGKTAGNDEGNEEGSAGISPIGGKSNI